MDQPTTEQMLTDIKARKAQIATNVKIGKKYTELMELPLFKELITEGYMRDEALRLVELKCDSTMNSADTQASLDRRICGISALQTFLRQYVDLGKAAMLEDAELNELAGKLESGMTMEQIQIEMLEGGNAVGDVVGDY